MKMVKMVALLMFVSIASIGSIGCKKVEAGNVGIKVFLLGGKKGVDHAVVNPGRYWIGWNTDLFIFPTYTVTYNFTKGSNEGNDTDESINFQTKEGLSVNSDIGISYHIQPDKVADVFQKYRKGIDEITHVFMRNMIRDSIMEVASKCPVESVYGEGKADLMKQTLNLVQKQVGDIGIVVEKIYFVSDLRLPDSVTKSLNSKIEANQIAIQKENELRQTEADAKKDVAKAEGEAQAILVKAKAEAESLAMKAKSITMMNVALNAIEKWDGRLPQFIVSGNGVPMMLNMDDIKNNLAPVAPIPAPAEKK